MYRLTIVVLIVLTAATFPPQQVRAQNGELIEGLFRTWAGAQVEKERRKRAEAEARAREAERRRAAELNLPGRDPYEVQLPSGFSPGPGRVVPGGSSLGGPVIGGLPPLGQTTQRPRQINVRSRAVADYAQRLVTFSGDYDRLLAELRRTSANNAHVRALLPKALEVSATCDSILGRLNGLDSLATIEASHRSLDRRYRHVSFRVRSINGLDNRFVPLVRQCDQSCSLMCDHLQIQPQFDRGALRDIMITATTYMQALIDDLELATMERGRCRTLQHDCRLLRQQLIAASREIDSMRYDECVTRFTDFVLRWNRFSDQVYRLNDPFLSRRLDRVSECGDQTYALLWMPPPMSVSEVSGIASRLTHNLDALSKSMTFFALARMDANRQATLLASMRDLTRLAADLERLSESRASQRDLLRSAEAFDRRWCEVQPLLSELPSIRPGLLSETERGCQQLREVFGFQADYATPNRLTDLVNVAAALEGTSEALRQTLNSYGRYLRPSEYRKAVTDSANSFYRHSRELHELLSRSHRLGDRGHLAKIREEAEHLLSDWNQLAADLNEVESRGLTGTRALKVRRLQQELVPQVGQIGAALVAF